MFIGHFGVGFGAKKVAPSVSLGTLFLATQLVDLLWPTFLLLGIERVEIEPGATAVTPLNFVHYPITHSLLMVGVWAVAFGLVYGFLKKDGKGAVVLGLGVLSHWFLDLIVHRPDLPLYPGGSEKFGFGLWNSLAGSLVVEGIILAVGVALYARATTASNRKGRIAFRGLVAFLVLVHLSNLFGPVPQSAAAIGWAGQVQWLLVIWAYWVEKNRGPRERRP